MSIHRRFPLFALIILCLMVTACALPGLGTPRAPLSTAPVTTVPANGHTALAPYPAEVASTGGAGEIAHTPVTVHLPVIQLQAAATLTPPAAPLQNSPTPSAPRPSSSSLAPLILAVSQIQPPPPGILPQVNVFQAGGGSGYAGSDCENRPGELRWCSPFNGAVLNTTDSYESAACGFSNQPLIASVTLPDGTSRPAIVNGEPPRCREVTFLAGPGAPPGEYRITLIQGSSRLSDTFRLVTPDEAVGALFNNCAWLAGLPGGQPVRLLAFGLLPPGPNDPSPDAGLASWRFLVESQFTPDASRSLLVCPDPAAIARYPEMAYLAIPASGKPVLAGNDDVLRQFQGDCAGGPPSRLSTGKDARVLTKDLPLFPDPALSAKPLGLLPNGVTLTVTYGPACPAQGPWTWQVKTQDGRSGWLAETDHTGYFLEPIHK